MTRPLEHTELQAERRFLVTPAMSADAHGNSGIFVLSTPCLANELELTCVDACASLVDADSATVGTELSFRHLAATPVAAEVTCHARLIERNGRRMLFAISARDGIDLIAQGTHERCIIDTARFLHKVEDKSEKLKHSGP